MATPNISSTVNFVKKYPITLCGFSLLFMPSVYRLLLYFTPLLISTAIFIVAMMSWGPSMSSERGKKLGKGNDWAFNGSLKIYDNEEEEEEEEGEEEAVQEAVEASQKGKTMQQEDISIKGKASDVKPDPEMKLEQEPDPDYDEESKRVGTASNSANYGGQAGPDPDLHGDCVGAASYNACAAEPEHGERLGAASYTPCSAEPDPDLHGEGVGGASYNARYAEPDPDLHAEQNVEPAHDQDFSAAKHLRDHQHAGAEPAPQHAAEPDPDLHAESCAVHAKSEEAHVENDDLHASTISELRQKLGMIKRAPCSDDPRDILSHQPAERLQTLQAAA